jgi:hypothetical protein
MEVVKMVAFKKYGPNEVQVAIRISAAEQKWIKEKAAYHGSSQAFEVSRCVRQAMEAEGSKSKSSTSAAS